MKNVARHADVVALALVIGLIGASPHALAEADTFVLGDGHSGSKRVTTASTVVNAYTPVTAPVAAQATSIAVGQTAGFSSGDLVLVLQMGADAPIPDAGTSGPFDVSDAGVGRWELARIAAPGAGSLNLTAPLVSSFPAGITQLITVPEYTDLTITDGGSVVARAWDGSTGGVVALLVNGPLSNDETISASGCGYRGGAFQNPAPPPAASQGEGVSLNWGAHSQSNSFNAGGGGVTPGIEGGGGGAHAGNGGVGGGGTGLGGGALKYSALNRLVMGGGGGGGSTAATTNSSAGGGRGGGIVFIRADSLVGAGRLAATGSAGGGLGGDYGGAGGGGAAGTIHLRLRGAAMCQLLDVRGGQGGSGTGNSDAVGGGGGGGRILAQATTFAACPTTVGAGVTGTGGSPGEPTGSFVPGFYGDVTTVPGGFAAPASPTILSPANLATVTTRRPLISGAAQADASVALYVDGLESGRAATFDDGGFEVVPTADLADGNRRLEAAVEAQGVWSALSAPVFVTVLIPPPDAGQSDGGTADGGDVSDGGADAGDDGGATAGPPQFVSSPDTAAFCGAPYRYSASRVPAVEGEGPLTFSVRPQAGYSLPEGLTVDGATGEISWTPQPAQAGVHPLELVVTGPSGEAIQSFAISVECTEARPMAVKCGCSSGSSVALPLLLVLAGLRRRAAGTPA